MDQDESSIYICLQHKALISALEEWFSGTKVKIIHCKPDLLHPISEEEFDEIRKNAVVLFSSRIIILKILQGENKLKWIQSFSAGMDFLKKGVSQCPNGIQITRMGEGREDPMTEYVLGHILARERNFKVAEQCQEDKKWDRNKILHNQRQLSSVKVGILGAGQIGTKIATTLKSFGMELVGLCLHAKQPERDSPFTRIWQREDLSEFMEDCDYLVSILPGTSETKYMLSGDVLKSCNKKKPYFINIGRGNLIDSGTIQKAISEQWISGALLDVVENEPLAQDDPLWDTPNVTITPHISGNPGKVKKMVDVFTRNLEKFKRKEPLEYIFDWNAGY